MKEVSKEEFYDFINPQDVCVSVENEFKYPYTNLFKLRSHRKLVGKSVDSYTNGIEHQYPIVTKYYIQD